MQELHSKKTPGGLQLVFSYLDDCCLAGEQRAVSDAFHHLRQAAARIGLELNTEKCEVIPCAGHHSQLDRSLFPPHATYTDDGNFELLGGPIGDSAYCNSHTQKRVDKAAAVLQALGELPDPQVALLLLRHCASFGKLVFSLRVVPHRAHQAALHNFDAAVHACLESFLCTSLDESEWSLATLSTKLGGLGLRSAAQHSPAAFYASRAACHESCRKVDPLYAWDSTNPQPDVAAALGACNARMAPGDHLTGTEEESSTQQAMSKAIDTQTLSRLREARQGDIQYQAHLNHTTSRGAGQWLHVLPAKALRKHVDAPHYRTMVQRWLRAPLFHEPFHCPFCDGMVDVYGDHCLVCSCGGDRTKRHNLLRNEVFYICQSAGLAPEMERPGLLQPRPLVGALPENGTHHDPNENRRPADIYIPRWRAGAPAALDLAVTSGLRADAVRLSAFDGAAATKAYEDYKREYMDTEQLCLAEGITFIPIIAEADGGGWGPQAHKVFNALAKLKSTITGEHEDTTVSHILQSLNLTLHRENARAILRRRPQFNAAGSTILSAAAAAQATP